MKYIRLIHEKIVDRCGMLVSFACLIHCLALPFVYLLFPALELKETSSWSTHFFLAAFVLLFAVFGMIKGFLHHRNKTPIFLASLGAILILSALTVSPEHAHVDLDAHTMLTVLGSIMLVGSHAANLKSCRRCSCKKVAVVHHDTIKPNRRLAVVNE